MILYYMCIYVYNMYVYIYIYIYICIGHLLRGGAAGSPRRPQYAIIYCAMI